MGKKKPQTTTQTSTVVNNYSYQTPPETPELRDAKAAAAKLKGRVNPVIRGFYAGERGKLNEQFHNPLGSLTTPAIREASLKAGNEALSQQEAQAIATADFAEGDAEFQRKMAIAGMTAPQLVNAGGTTTGKTTTTQSSGIGGVIGTVASIAAPIALTAMTGGAGGPAAAAMM